MFNSVLSLSLVAMMLVFQLFVVVLSAIAVVMFSILDCIKNNLIFISFIAIGIVLFIGFQ